MSDEKKPQTQSGWHSRSADAAAARWGEKHPDEDPDHPTPSRIPEDESSVPNRHSASAEAASLRWRERHDEDS